MYFKSVIQKLMADGKIEENQAKLEILLTLICILINDSERELFFTVFLENPDMKLSFDRLEEIKKLLRENTNKYDFTLEEQLRNFVKNNIADAMQAWSNVSEIELSTQEKNVIVDKCKRLCAIEDYTKRRQEYDDHKPVDLLLNTMLASAKAGLVVGGIAGLLISGNPMGGCIGAGVGTIAGGVMSIIVSALFELGLFIKHSIEKNKIKKFVKEEETLDEKSLFANKGINTTLHRNHFYSFLKHGLNPSPRPSETLDSNTSEHSPKLKHA